MQIQIPKFKLDLIDYYKKRRILRQTIRGIKEKLTLVTLIVEEKTKERDDLQEELNGRESQRNLLLLTNDRNVIHNSLIDEFNNLIEQLSDKISKLNIEIESHLHEKEQLQGDLKEKRCQLVELNHQMNLLAKENNELPDDMVCSVYLSS